LSSGGFINASRPWAPGVVLLALLPAGICGCARPDVGAERSEDASAELLPVELPPLDRFDAPVHEQLERVHAEVTRLRDELAPDRRLAEAYGALGMHLHAYSLLDAALPAYRNARRLDATDDRWPCYLGALQQRRNDLEAADARYTECVERRPDYLAGWVRLGQVRLERGTTEPARTAFARALALDPGCAAAMVGLGMIEARAKRFESARGWFEDALERAPEADNVQFHLAMTQRALGDVESAARHMEARGEVKAGVSDPLLDVLGELAGGVRSLTDRGQRLGRAGRFDEAAAVLQQAIEADPEDAVARLYLGIVRTRQGRLDDALTCFGRVTELTPNDERAYLFAGRIHAARGDDAEARETFREAVRLHPELAAARLELGQQLQRGGEPLGALEQFARAVALDPGNPRARLGRAFARIRLGRWAEARTGLEEDLLTLPEEPAFAHALARLLAAAPDNEVRDGDRALALAEELSRSMQNLDLGETIGMAFAESGRFEEAANWQRQLIELARQAGEVDRVPRLEQNLSRYESRRACRLPWPANDPVFAIPRPAAVTTMPDDADGRE